MARDDRMWGHDSFSYECWEKGYCLRDVEAVYNRKKRLKNMNKIKLFRTDIIYYWKNNILYYKDISGEKKHEDQRSELYFEGTIIKDSLKTNFKKNPLVAFKIGRPDYYGIRKEKNHFSKYLLEKENIIDLSCLDDIPLNPPIIQVTGKGKTIKNIKNTKLNFNIKDLDPILLEKIINENIDSIYNSPNARKGRTREQIRLKVSQGIPCEVYMIQFHNCIENTELYGDVIKPNGLKIECKSSIYEWDDYKKNKMIDSIKGYSPSNVCMFWQKIGDNYIYQGTERIQEW